jgi:plastocyanin
MHMRDLGRRNGVPALSRRAPAALVLVPLLAACGGSGGGPAAPGAAAPAAATPSSSFTVTITATGASPRELRVPVGARVTFVNQDNRSHQMMSDPHPVHTDCPEVNAVGNLDRGQTKTTDMLSTQKSCGFHDNLRDGDASLRGFILVGAAEPGGPGY